ncbi:MAG: hypothetical protein KC589_05200 [Nanoarchaeota archaeon]|nr:hypothetical protein [Nanoarchaeota archaeon]
MDEEKKLLIPGYDFVSADRLFVSNDDHFDDSNLEADERFAIVPNVFWAPKAEEISDLIKTAANKMLIFTGYKTSDEKNLQKKIISSGKNWLITDPTKIGIDENFSELEIAMLSLQKNYGNTFLLEIAENYYEEELEGNFYEYQMDKYLEEGKQYLGLSYGRLKEDKINSGVKVFSEIWDAGFYGKWFARIRMFEKRFPKKKDLSFLIRDHCEKSATFYFENNSEFEVFYDADEVLDIVLGVRNLGYKSLNGFINRTKKTKQEIAHNIFINFAIQMDYVFPGIDSEIDFADTLIPGEKSDEGYISNLIKKNQKVFH